MYQRVYTISKKDFKKVDTRFSEEISSKSLPKFKAQKSHKRSVYATFGLGGEKGIRTPEVVLALTRFPIVLDLPKPTNRINTGFVVHFRKSGYNDYYFLSVYKNVIKLSSFY